MNYIPLFVHSHYSILQGLNKPKEIISAAKKLNISAIALTDINTMAGHIEFYQEAKKQGIKPILGSLINTTEGTLLLIAKNEKGYTTLLEIIGDLNSISNFKNNEQSISLNDLSKFNTEDIIAITGHEGSGLYNCIGVDFKIKTLWEDLTKAYLENLTKAFKNIYLEWQYSEYDTFSKESKKTIQEISKKYNLPMVMTPRVHYLKEEDKELFQILISIKEKKSLAEINQINSNVYKFFDGYKFHMPSFDELEDKSYVENTIKIADSIEDYSLLKSPILPKFNTPKKESSEEYFKTLCRIGWEKKIMPILKSEEEKTLYLDRVKQELKVFKEADLFDYFLIIKDIIDYTKSLGYLTGISRGSVGGCLTAWLLDITEINSIKHNLIFERFYSAGRKDSLPDIDIDVESASREKVIEYIIKKYGKSNVAQLATYGTLMGRAALKAIFRAYNDLSFAEQNEITKHVPDKSKISDELQEMKNLGQQATVLKWALINKKKYFENWCTIKEDILSGPLAKKFEQAIKLEGVISNLSKHAAAVVISPTSLKKLIPLIFDPKNKQQIIATEMQPLEKAGLVKMDVLGLSVLDRLHDINKI